MGSRKLPDGQERLVEEPLPLVEPDLLHLGVEGLPGSLRERRGDQHERRRGAGRDLLDGVRLDLVDLHVEWREIRRRDTDADPGSRVVHGKRRIVAEDRRQVGVSVDGGRGLVVRNRRRPLRPGHGLEGILVGRHEQDGRVGPGLRNGRRLREGLRTGLRLEHGRRLGTRAAARSRAAARRPRPPGRAGRRPEPRPGPRPDARRRGGQLTGQRVARVDLAQPLDGVGDAPLFASLQQGLHRPLGRLGGPLPVSQRLADVADPLQGVRVLRVGQEELLDVVERLLVQAVLQIDVGLGEDPVDRVLRRDLRDDRPTTGGRVTCGGATRVSGGAGRRAGAGRLPPGAARRRGAGRRRWLGRTGRGRWARLAARSELLARLGVVREELLHHAPGEGRLVAPPPLGVDPGQGAVDGDGLGHLSEVAERLRHETQRVHVLLVGAVADLELAEGLLGLAPGQVLLGQLLGELQVVGREREDALGELDVLVAPLVLPEVGGGAVVELEGLGAPVGLGVEVAETLAGEDVFRVEVEEPPEHVEVAPLVAGLLEGRGHRLELVRGVVEEAQLLVEAGQLLVHPDVVGGELGDLLVDRHRLEEEALLAVDLGHLVEGAGRAGAVPLLLLDLADLEEDADLLLVLGEDLLVGLDGLVVLPLLDESGRLGDDLVLVDRHRRDRFASGLADHSPAGGGAGPERERGERSERVERGQGRQVSRIA